ncbi:MAG: stage III sporulation protein AA [Firmicutes bacterium]|nr:stage III sporulation protein AA [Bacillota bacterium]
MDNIQRIFRQVPYSVMKDLEQVPSHLWNSAEELRLRRGYPATLVSSGDEFLLSGDVLGKVTQDLLNNIINKFLNYSEYAHDEEMRCGYIALEGGHRAGFCGQVVSERGSIVSIRNISSINIRFAREIPDAGVGVFPVLFDETGRFQNTVIAAPPGCGKTTLLRNLIRLLSDRKYTVAVCDERNEIAGTGSDQFAFNLGSRVDVMSHCSKTEGMILILRSMGPQILATDEIGNAEEIQVLRRVVAAGVGLLTTIHAGSFQDLLVSPLGPMICEGSIGRILFLSDRPRRGTITGIWKKEQAERKKL